MNSTTNPTPSDHPHEILVVAPDVALMVPTDEELAKLARSMRHAASPEIRTATDLPPGGPAVPPVDTTFRAAAVGDVPGRRRMMAGRAARSFMAALLVTACTGAAGIAWQSYGDTAEQLLAQWTPQRILASLLPKAQPVPPADPTPTAAGAIAANTPADQPGSAAQTTPETVAPAAAAPTIEAAPPVGSAAGDIVSARKEIEQLKATIEELKASQQQMSRDLAKASEARASEARTSEPRASEAKASLVKPPEASASVVRPSAVKPAEARASVQNLRPKMPAHPPRATVALARKPTPPLPPQQAAAYPPLPPPVAPYVPRQVEPQPATTGETLTDPELASVPRPPMPVR